MADSDSSSSLSDNEYRENLLKEIEADDRELMREAKRADADDENDPENSHIVDAFPKQDGTYNPFNTLSKQRKKKQVKSLADNPFAEPSPVGTPTGTSPSPSSSNLEEKLKELEEREKNLKEREKKLKKKKKDKKDRPSKKEGKDKTTKSSSEVTKSGLALFRTIYTEVCDKESVKPINSLLNWIERGITRGASILNLDFSMHSLRNHDIQALTKAFKRFLDHLDSKEGKATTWSDTIDPTNIDLKNNSISNVRTVFELVCEIGTVKQLDLSWNPLEVNCGLTIAENLKNYSKLTSFKAAGIKFDSRELMAMLSALKDCTGLQHLDLAEHDMKYDAKMGQLLSDIITSCPLLSLNVGYNDLSGITKSLTSAIGQCKTLMDLDVSSVKIGPKIKDLLDALDGRTNFVKFAVGFNKFPSGCGSKLVKFVNAQKNMKILDVRYGDEDLNAKCIKGCLDGLLQNSVASLMELNLNGNALDKKTIESVMAILPKAPGMKTLHLRACGLNEAALVALVRQVESSSYIETLDISGNKVTEKAANAIASMMAKSATLNTLSLISCAIKDKKTITTLANGLKTGHIVRFNMDGNKLEEKGLKALADGFKGTGQSTTVISVKATSANTNGIAYMLEACTGSSLLLVDARDNGLPDSSSFKEKLTKANPKIIVRL